MHKRRELEAGQLRRRLFGNWGGMMHSGGFGGHSSRASEEELETAKSRLRQQRGMNDLSRKSGTRMRADVQVSRADLL